MFDQLWPRLSSQFAALPFSPSAMRKTESPSKVGAKLTVNELGWVAGVHTSPSGSVIVQVWFGASMVTSCRNDTVALADAADNMIKIIEHRNSSQNDELGTEFRLDIAANTPEVLDEAARVRGSPI
jgi:hypothetical protein